MDYHEMYKTYMEINEFIEDYFGKHDYVDRWEITATNLELVVSYEVDCDVGCGYHQADVIIPIQEFTDLFNAYRNNKKTDH